MACQLVSKCQEGAAKAGRYRKALCSLEEKLIGKFTKVPLQVMFDAWYRHFASFMLQIKVRFQFIHSLKPHTSASVKSKKKFNVCSDQANICCTSTSLFFDQQQATSNTDCTISTRTCTSPRDPQLNLCSKRRFTTQLVELCRATGLGAYSRGSSSQIHVSPPMSSINCFTAEQSRAQSPSCD